MSSSLVTATSQRRMNKKIKINFVRTQLQCIRKLLRVEEALFRHSREDWVIINDGVEKETIVLGISGKPEELVHELKAKQLRVPLVKRFTGGGTVVVDKNTQFVSFIFNEGTVEGLELFPRKIMEWSGTFYGKAVEGMFSSPPGAKTSAPLRRDKDDFSLRENDYVFGEKKFGGNAQSISKSRFIHHTSFLYDYDKALMDLLKSPRKQPEYRENRTHDDFVATLKSKYTEIGKEEESEDKRRELLLGAVYESLREHRDFEVRSVSFDAAENVLLDYNENVKPSTVKLWCDKERKWNVCDD